MNKVILETDLVDKALEATHKIRQPSWAAHCMALGINMDEAEKEAEAHRTRPTMRIKTPAYDFRPTPLYVVIPPEAKAKAPQADELDLDWEV